MDRCVGIKRDDDDDRMVGCVLVVHYWLDLQSVHGFRCYDNIIALNAKCQRVLYSLYTWLLLLLMVSLAL